MRVWSRNRPLWLPDRRLRRPFAWTLARTTAVSVTDSAPMPLLPLGPLPDAGVTQQIWTGHLVKDQFPDGSNTLTMTIDFAPGGQITGSILLGNGAIFAPPTDCGNIRLARWQHRRGDAGRRLSVRHPERSLEESHLTLQFSENEAWTCRCAFRTSYPSALVLRPE